jgi:hypothetical protein
MTDLVRNGAGEQPTPHRFWRQFDAIAPSCLLDPKAAVPDTHKLALPVRVRALM